jgi:chromosome segregation ATPase
MHKAPEGQASEIRKLEEEIGLCPATSYHQREPAQQPDAEATAGPEWRGLSQDLTTALGKRNLENADLQAEVERLHAMLTVAEDAIRNLSFGKTVVVEGLKEARASLEAAEGERDALREALHAIKSELGVPGDGYPAPVSNAAEIARAALAPKEATQ